jgi:paraquat-inducible protein A
MASSPPVSRRLICEDCDTVYRVRELRVGEIARCTRCGAVLERPRRFGLDALAALVAAALIVFVQGNIWPVVSIGLNGQQNSTTLWGMITIMWSDHSQIVAVITAFTLFFFPLSNMLIVAWLVFFARRGRRAPGFRPLMLAMYYVGPWTMSEVFVLGALVAMVKAKAYFDVTPDAGIYAYAALTIFITVFAGIDLRYLWDSVPENKA